MAYQFSGVGARGGQGPDIGIQNYATLSDRIRGSVDSAIDEHRERMDRQREREREAMLKERQQLQLAQLKQNQYETLNVPADTGIPSADQYLQGASRALVDEQALLVNSLKNGDISTDEFAHKSAIIKSQVPQLQAVKEGMTGFQDNYQTLLEAGEMSAANDGQAAELYDAMMSGDISIGPDENGMIRITNSDGTINMPANAVGRIPQPIKKAQPLNLMVKATAEGMAGSPEFDANAVRKQLDNMISSPNDNRNNDVLKSIAVDNGLLTLDQANQMLNTPLEDDENGNTNELEKFVEDAMVEEAQKQHAAAEYQREIQRLQQAQKEIQIANTQSLINQRDSQAIQKQIAVQQAEERQAQLNQQLSDLGQIADRSPEGAMQHLQALGITNVVHSPKQGWVQVDPKTGKAVQLIGSAAGLQQYVARKYNTNYTDPNFGESPSTDSPVQRKSVFKRMMEISPLYK